MTAYVYIRTESGLWTAGFYRPDGGFEPESDHGTGEDAAKRVAWLNGDAAAEAVGGIGLTYLTYLAAELHKTQLKVDALCRLSGGVAQRELDRIGSARTPEVTP